MTHPLCMFKSDYETGLDMDEGAHEVDSDVEREARADYSRRNDTVKDRSFEREQAARDAMKTVGTLIATLCCLLAYLS